MAKDRERALELLGLEEKAARSQAGTVIGNLAYGPDYHATVGDMRVTRRTAQEKNCKPPIAVDPATRK